METACNKTANKSRSQIRLHSHSYHQIFVTMYENESLLQLLSFDTDKLFSLISSVTASCCACSVVTRMFPFFNVAWPGQLSSTHFKYFIFLRAVSDVQLSIMFVFKSSIAQQRINISMYVSVQAWVYCTTNFTCAFFTRAFHTCVVYMPIPLPAQSIWCTLHAISIICAIHTPKMTITRSFITCALSHPVAMLCREKIKRSNG